MRPLLAFVFIILQAAQWAYGQTLKKTEWKIGTSSGWGANTVSDFLLNRYHYSGSSLLHFKVFASAEKLKHHFTIQCAANKLTLDPNHINETYYEYNYLDKATAELFFSYLYLLLDREKFKLWAGGGNVSFFSAQDEFYRSNLYPFGLNHRKSYLLSPVNLMPLLSVDYLTGNNFFRLAAGYAIVNISARPDDLYVKQIDFEGSRDWNAYLADDFSAIRYTLVYQHRFGILDVALSYETSYYQVSSFKNLHHIVSAGLVISF